jgi:hypothetical protein
MNQVNDKHARGNRACRICLLRAVALHGSTKPVPAKKGGGTGRVNQEQEQ